MAGQALVLPGRLVLVAEQLVLALRRPAADQPAFVLGWYAVAYAATAPAGNLAGRQWSAVSQRLWRGWFGRPLSSGLVALAEVFREAAT